MARFRTLLVLLLLAAPWNAQAHDVPASAVLLDIGRTTVAVELQLPLSELGAALSQPLAKAPERVIPESGERITAYVLQHIRVTTPQGAAYTPVVRSLRLRRTENPSWVSNDWLVVNLRMHAPQGASTAKFALDYDVILERVVTHNVLVSVRSDFSNALFGDRPQTIGLIAFQRTHLDIDGSSGSWQRGFAQIFSLGAKHISEGTDHLLFLLVLLLPAPLIARAARWREADGIKASFWRITKVVSGFTVGHSLTLALGALGIVSVPSEPVEIIIAASILISALHAWRPIFHGKEAAIAAAFGLAHGLAFSETLRGLGYDSWTLAMSLAGFNLGIEAMQLVIVACVLPLLIPLSRTRAYGAIRLLAASCGALCALGWIAERAWHLPNPMSPLVGVLSDPPTWIVWCLAGTGLLAGARLCVREPRQRFMRRRTDWSPSR